MKYNQIIFKKYSTQMIYEKLLDINVPQVEAQKLSIANRLKNKNINFDELKEKYKPKNIKIPYKYAIHNNMIYEIESVIDIVKSSKGKEAYYLKLKHLREIYLYSRKKCFQNYEDAVNKKNLLREKKKKDFNK